MFICILQGDLQNLEDASDDLLMVEDESVPIPFVVGEVFVHLNMEETKVMCVLQSPNLSTSKP